MRTFIHRRWRRAERWVAGQRKALTEFRLRRAREHREAAEERRHRMLEDQAQVQAMAKAVLAQLNAAQMEALRVEIRSQLLEEVAAEADERAMARLEDTLRHREEQLQDRFARLQADYEADLEQRIEAGIANGLQDAEQEWADERGDLRRQRNEARAARDAAEHQLLALLRQLLSETGRYLRNAHVAEFDQHAVNLILKKHGWRVRSQATYSERTVKTRVGEANWQLRALFWIEAVPPEGVADEDEGDESNLEDQGLVSGP